MSKSINVDNRCTGCNICVSLCPSNAITLKISDEGFWYPFINQNICVECGKCLVGCPVYGGKGIDEFFEPISYVGWNRDIDERLDSSSGGVFSLIAKSVLEGGGVVYGAAYNDIFDVEHVRIENKQDLNRLRRSKYVQSYISEDLMSILKKDIDSGIKVLFSGTPCQVAGINKIYHYYDNLLTVDVVCHGVPSPKAWRYYLNERIADKGKIKSINMRKKTNGWKKFNFYMEFCDQSVEECWFNENIWGFSFVKNIFLRKSCYHCEFKDKIRCSDISLGDFWEASRGLHKEFDDHDRGTSIILANSEKGINEIIKLQMQGQCFMKNIPYHWIPKNTYAVISSSMLNPNRNQAFELLNKDIFSSVVKKMSGETDRRKLVRTVKAKMKHLIFHTFHESQTRDNEFSRFDCEGADVGILNVQEVDNYGAVLLCFALQNVIERLGYKAKVIDYRPVILNREIGCRERFIKKLKEEGFSGVSKAIIRKLSGKEKTGVNISSDLKKRRFEEFRETFLHRTPVYRGMGTADSPIFDTYVVGSDVVWKPARVMSDEADIYFLNFTEGLLCNRVAYAASIGTDDQASLSEIAPLFKKYISKFDHLSLREKSTIPFVEELYGADVTWCIDPTLLLKQEDYDTYFSLKSNETTRNDYIYLYLFESSEAAYEMANRYSKELGMPIICQCDMPDKINNLIEFSSDDGPIEFLHRIRNAKLVITDSFHGTVFSIIYQKDFVTLSRGNISIRMKDLLARLNLLCRYVDRPETATLNLKSIDYTILTEIINDWREESMNYLCMSLASKQFEDIPQQ